MRLDPRDIKSFQRRLPQIDVAFIALHGHGGEDGSIQRLLKKRGIPYVGSDAVSSRRTFDKVAAKKIFRRVGIPTPEYRVIDRRKWASQLNGFKGPYFVKPIQEGSSIGAFAVEDLKKSSEKLKRALKIYSSLLVEKKIEGREFTVGIFGRKPLPVMELKPKRPFYDYRAKYTKGMTDYLVPAPLPKKVAQRLQALAYSVHQALGLRDFSRVDLKMDLRGRPFVLEANSIPGFTELSLLPKAARAAGISFEALCFRLVDWAYQRRNGTISHG